MDHMALKAGNMGRVEGSDEEIALDLYESLGMVERRVDGREQGDEEVRKAGRR